MSRILFLLDSLADSSACRILGQWILNLQQKGHLVQLCLHTDHDAQDANLPFCPCKVLLHEAILQNPSLSISWSVYYRLRNQIWQGASSLWPALSWGRDTDIIIADQSLFCHALSSLLSRDMPAHRLDQRPYTPFHASPALPLPALRPDSLFL